MMARAERSDEELLAAAGRDPQAFGIFYRRHGEAVVRYRDRFAGLPQSLRIRVFQAVVPARIAPDNGRPIVIQTARDGDVATSHPFRTPRRGTSGLTLP
jgi:hypothetical protein